MSQHTPGLKPLFLSEEEALALLDLCLLSSADTPPAAECALMKLAGLVRRFVAANILAESAVVTQRADRAVGPVASDAARKPIMPAASYSLESWIRLTAGPLRATLPPCDHATPW